MSIYREEREVPYPAERLFDLVADVESYPDFLPWWAAARIIAREDGAYRTDQVIRFGPIRQRFPTRTVLRRPREIDVTATGGRLRRRTAPERRAHGHLHRRGDAGWAAGQGQDPSDQPR